jgi:beta-RFAP synthase
MCHVEVLEAPREHVGLGTGTQVTLATVAGLQAFAGGEPLPPEDLARIAGRAARSAVGTYGFKYGGLLMEAGKRRAEALSPLERRLTLPVDWRFVLVVPRAERGLSGEEERRAFEALPPVSHATTTALRALLVDALFPAAECGDFVRFSDALFRYGVASGQCFAARQGGPFANPRVADLVERVRTLGVRGVGQSSWGPTVFALVDNPAAADTLVARLRAHATLCDLIVSRVNNTGARVMRQAAEAQS